MIAALFVEKGGVYYGLPDVDPWDEERDARLYAGPWPVVAHPPCGPWGVFARQGKTLKSLGDDEGCFEAALANVRRCGGVLEHPKFSTAWERFNLPRPNEGGGWTRIFGDKGWSCEVHQGEYGLACDKQTWLYAVGDAPPIPTRWGSNRSYPTHAFDNMGKSARARTPIAFRDFLLSIARSAHAR